MTEHGPPRLTVDHVARQLGVSAPALLRRFGSKRALPLSVSVRALILAQVAAIRASLRSLVGAVVAGGELAGDVERIADLLEMRYNGRSSHPLPSITARLPNDGDSATASMNAATSARRTTENRR